MMLSTFANGKNPLVLSRSAVHETRQSSKAMSLVVTETFNAHRTQQPGCATCVTAAFVGAALQRICGQRRRTARATDVVLRFAQKDRSSEHPKVSRAVRDKSSEAGRRSGPASPAGPGVQIVKAGTQSTRRGGSTVFSSLLSGALLGAAALLVAGGPALAATVTIDAAGSAGLDLATVWQKAASSAFKGGFAGLVAGVLQVFSFMWLRTAMNFQYFNGGNLSSALSSLWQEGGLRRLYQGVSLALIQAPLSRFGDTAANAGVMVLMDFYLPGLSLPLKTAASSTAAAFWRLLLTPIDTLKTASQVQGESGFELLIERVNKNGFGELYAGALASFAANWVGNYPYFVVFNVLSDSWIAPDDPAMRIVRNGVLGVCSSIASDVVSNSLRVLKTIRQSSRESESYLDSAKRVVDNEGFGGLLGRGLETRLLVNVLQGTFFTIIWKLVEEKLSQ